MTEINQKQLDTDQHDEVVIVMDGLSSYDAHNLTSDTGGQIFHCEICYKTFTSTIKFEEHILAHSDMTYKAVESNGGELLSCETCGEAFSSKVKFHEHILAHSGVTLFKCEECDKNFTKKKLKDHIRYVHSNFFTCKNCGQTFDTRKSLKEHEHIHIEKKLTCEECKTMFENKSSLRKHTEKFDLRVFKCAQCGRPFKLKTISCKQNCVKEIFCDDCDTYKTGNGGKLLHCKTYIRKSNLTRHTTLHVYMKEFKCAMCGKSFKHKTDLNYHKQNSCDFRDTGIFTCDHCGKNFFTKSAITEHVLTH